MLKRSMMKETTLQRRGLMLVFSSPSGAGKTSMTRRLLALEENLTLSISATTRPRRHGETSSQDYHFLSTEEFVKLRDENGFMEHAKVFDHYYGTPREPVEKALNAGRDILFDIDWQGTQSLRQSDRGDLVTIFILPPSWEELEGRLKTRAQDTPEVIAKRMAKASDEMSHWAEYDYVIVNHDLDESVRQARSILHSERLKRIRQIGLSNFVKTLRQKG